MMELGQTNCLPRSPLCPTCPLSKWCLGFQSDNPEEFPIPRPRRASEAHHLAIALIRRGNEVAMVRGLEEGLLDDLWNFPAAFGSTEKEALAALESKLEQLTRAQLTIGKPIGRIRHTITYRSIQGRVFPVETSRSEWHKSIRWLPLQEVSKGAISQLARKVVHKLGAF